MSVIEANVTIDIPDGRDPSEIIALIKNTISQINNKGTNINVIEVDNPLSLSPLTMKKLEE